MRGKSNVTEDKLNIDFKEIDEISRELIETQSVTAKKDKVKKLKCDLSEFNTYLFHQGRNYYSYSFMGAHLVSEERKKGVRFTTWAPKAKNVYVVGDFSDFEIKEEFKMEKITEMGLWSIFVPELKVGMRYKYSIEDGSGRHNYKTDPYGIKSELRPDTASIIFDREKDRHKWQDRSWMAKRRWFNMYESPINTYELHLGSWKRKDNNFLTYRELAEELPSYLKEMGYTHVEILPIMEHPLDKSWGYQGVGYYSVTSRYGDLNDFKYLVDKLHQQSIGVILDWVPGHFCKDEHGLRNFDGSPTYEYEESWKAENKGWGTCNFDLGRPEVKSFLISNAAFWIKECHIDGLRVDAVSNMLYLNYCRDNDYWQPNIYGDNRNLEAIDFIQNLNNFIRNEFQNVMMIAEESTTWPKISRAVEDGGLGFNFKWNMGWMNDTLAYVKEDPIFRKYHHHKLTFSMAYHNEENYILPISHDEVVHGKKSLLEKMWGDGWNKFAGVRLYAAHMIAHPGKKLLFMGSEFGHGLEWREYEALEWNLVDDLKINRKTKEYFKVLNNFYKENKALWQLDYDTNGFQWIDADNVDNSIYSFIRRGKEENDLLICTFNYTPVVHYDFRIGVPCLGEYKEVLNSDNESFGGSGQVIEEVLIAEEVPCNNQPYSILVKIPPMAALILSKK